MTIFKPSVVICSPPKMGRTLLRYLISLYLNRFYQLQIPEDLTLGHLLIPNYRYAFGPAKNLEQDQTQTAINSTDGEENGEGDGEGQQSRLRNVTREQIQAACLKLVKHDAPILSVSHTSQPSRKLTQQLKIILLLRNVFDSLVSRYNEQRYRRPSESKGAFHGERTEYIKSSPALEDLVDYLNAWSQHWQQHKDTHQLLTTTYEQLCKQKFQTATQILEFVGVPVDLEILNSAVQDSSFEKMQSQAIANLGSQYSGNTGQLRIRSGRIKGYKSVLSADEIGYIQEYLETHLSKSSQQLIRRYELGPKSWVPTWVNQLLPLRH